MSTKAKLAVFTLWSILLLMCVYTSQHTITIKSNATVAILYIFATLLFTICYSMFLTDLIYEIKKVRR